MKYRLPQWAYTLAPAVITTLPIWRYVTHDNPPVEIGAAVVACLALLLRRFLPITVLAITTPALALLHYPIPTMVALYTVARSYRNPQLIIGLGTIVAFIVYLPQFPKVSFDDVPSMLTGLISSISIAAAPAALGWLARACEDLTSKIEEIERARKHERQLIEQETLARERAQLAREMHDVVSHQVTLISVTAAALQVSAPDPGTKQIASKIRELSATTLDELRHMVTVLRASGSQPTELTPQPTLADLDQLIADCGITIELHEELSADVAVPQQRAIYRAIQEALTNARKHAPGAKVDIHIEHSAGQLIVTVKNGPPTHPTLNLPSAQHGLVGLRERAELLHGTFENGPTTDGGYRVHLRLPAETN